MHRGKSRESGSHTSQWRLEPLLTFECPVSLHSAGLLTDAIAQNLLVPLCFDALAQDSLSEAVTAMEPGVVHKLYLLRCFIFPFHPLRPCVLANWLQKIKPRGKERQRLYKGKCPGRFPDTPSQDGACRNNAQGFGGAGAQFWLLHTVSSAIPHFCFVKAFTTRTHQTVSTKRRSSNLHSKISFLGFHD